MDINHRKTPSSTLKTTTISADAKQIIDILPSYISLFQTSAASTTPPPPSPDRTAILKWFSTLSPPQRAAHLTVVDSDFTRILLKMLPHIRRHRHVTFFLLLDLPSADLLHRRSHPRLSDSSELTRLISSSILLSSSRDGEGGFSDAVFDTVSFREEFVGDLENFVGAMDRVSGGGFLNGAGEDWAELGLEKVVAEMRWLKDKGYFSLEAFVANRVEVALRMAWLSSGSGGGGGGKGKKGVGVKVKEKAKNSVGLGINLYWRKRGCVDWWERLSPEVQRKVFRTTLGTAAKSLTDELLKGTLGIMEEGLYHFDGKAVNSSGNSCRGPSSTFDGEFLRRRVVFGLTSNISSSSKLPASLVCAINRLIVLQEIIAIALASPHGYVNKEKIFFSSLYSVNTISDKILRKLRGLLMVVSLDSTKLELLEEGNQQFVPNKAKEKISAIHRKKKGKNRNSKRSNPSPNNCEVELSVDKNFEDQVQKVVPERVQTSSKRGKQNKKKKLRGKSISSSDFQSSSAVMQENLSSCSTAEHGGERCEVRHLSAALRKSLNVSPTGCQSVEQSSGPCICKSSSRDNVLSGNNPGNFVACVKREGDSLADSYLSLDNQKNDEIALKLDSVNHLADTEIGFVSDKTCNSACIHKSNCDRDPQVVKAGGFQSVRKNEECHKDRVVSQTGPTPFLYRKTGDVDNQTRYNGPPVIPAYYPSYEWPAVTPLRLASLNSQHIPPATDRLHLEVGHNWRNHFQPSFIQQMHQANSAINGRTGRILSRPLDWPPVLRTCNYDSTFFSRQQAAAQQGFTAQSPHKGGVKNEDVRKYPADCYDLSEPLGTQDFAEEYDGHWVSEEEYEVHAVSGVDYNQYFGGGVMYWDPSDYRGTGFSRPPSLSSDDSSWAWREADMNRTVDDMVAFSSSYSTNGLNSPSAAPFCSPFESLPPGHQAIGYVRSGNEGKVLHKSSTMTDLEVEENVSGSAASIPSDSDAKSGDSLPYPILRPIIIPSLSRERSRSEFKGNHDLRSPRAPPNRREHPRIKRPPSPVVLCVPRAPCPPPPSPVGDSKKHRGFPTVRSGSSSPRHWGVRGWFHDGNNMEESCVRVDGAEVVWPSWRNTNFSAGQLVQPLPGALLQDRLIAISQLTHDQEHPDVALPLRPPELLHCQMQKASLLLMHNLLHEEIDSFCKQVAAENLIRRPYVNWAVKRVTRSLQVLWPRSRTNIFGSNATGLSLPSSDVDLVVCLPPVRNLEPIKEAGILEGRNSIKETCLQHAARYLGNQEWVKADSLKTVENTAIPIIMLIVDVPKDFVAAPAVPTGQTSLSEQNHLDGGQNAGQSYAVCSGNSLSPTGSEIPSSDKGSISVRLDISFKSPSHTGLETSELVKQLTDQFPAAIPLALVLKKFLADRSLDQSYSGGLSSYSLVLMITRFLQHEHHHGRPINQNLGGLFMDFLYFYGNVFDPRQMRISIQGSGSYINRERGYSIDPIYIDDPLFPINNVGRNCFRIHQCIKAFADAYSTLEAELSCLATEGDENPGPRSRLLPKIIPSLSLP